MTTRRIVHEFAAGDPVPEWLFAVDPYRPDSVKPAVTFTAAGCIVETGEGFVVVPDAPIVPVIKISDGSYIIILSGSRPVMLPSGFSVHGTG